VKPPYAELHFPSPGGLDLLARLNRSAGIRVNADSGARRPMGAPTDVRSGPVPSRSAPRWDGIAAAHGSAQVELLQPGLP
jgi:hypothetical protein